MKNILITGISGYLAPYLCIELEKSIENGDELNVTGLYNSNKIKRKKINLLQCDLNDTARLKNIFKETKPGTVYHLASVTPTRIGNKPEGYVEHFNAGVTAEIAKLCSEYN